MLSGMSYIDDQHRNPNMKDKHHQVGHWAINYLSPYHRLFLRELSFSSTADFPFYNCKLVCWFGECKDYWARLSCARMGPALLPWAPLLPTSLPPFPSLHPADSCVERFSLHDIVCPIQFKDESGVMSGKFTIKVTN